MNISKTRKHILELNEERNELVKTLLRPGKMVQGSLYQIARVCGNPNCKCARGEKHVSGYLSTREKGRTKLTYVGPAIPMQLEERAQRYQRRRKRLARIREIDREISRLLNMLRDAAVVSFTRRRRTKR